MPALLRPYVELLAPRSHSSLFAAGLIARVPSAVLGFSTLLLVQATTGSFATGGLVAGTIVGSSAIMGPILGRLADRHGQRVILRTVAPIHLIAVLAVLVLAELRVVPAVIVLIATVAGASMTPVGSFTRARWSHIYSGAPLVRSAFALESVLDDVVWIVGPAFAAFLSVTVSPASGLLVCAATGITGSIILSFLRSTDTPPRARELPRKHFHPFSSIAFVTVLAAGLVVGLAFGINDVSAIAISAEDGVRQDAGLILAVFSIGSLLGGAVFGASPERLSPFSTFALVCAYQAVTWIPLAFAPNTGWIMVFGLIAGSAAAPFIIAANRVIESRAPREVVTEALAWVSASVVSGMAAGSLLGGAIIDAWGARTGFLAVSLLMVVPFVFAAIAVTATLPRSRTTERIYPHGNVRS